MTVRGTESGSDSEPHGRQLGDESAGPVESAAPAAWRPRPCGVTVGHVTVTDLVTMQQFLIKYENEIPIFPFML